jgi:hypothetical protein
MDMLKLHRGHEWLEACCSKTVYRTDSNYSVMRQELLTIAKTSERVHNHRYEQELWCAERAGRFGCG